MHEPPLCRRNISIKKSTTLHDHLDTLKGIFHRRVHILKLSNYHNMKYEKKSRIRDAKPRSRKTVCEGVCASGLCICHPRGLTVTFRLFFLRGPFDFLSHVPAVFVRGKRSRLYYVRIH